MPRISCVGKRAEMAIEGNTAVQIAARMSVRGVADVSGINTLGQQSESAHEVQVLGVVVESENRFHFARTDAKPGLVAVICECPIEGGMPSPKVAQVAIVDLGANPQMIVDLRRGIRGKIRELAAPYVAGVHRQPVVVIGVDEAL